MDSVFGCWSKEVPHRILLIYVKRRDTRPLDPFSGDNILLADFGVAKRIEDEEGYLTGVAGTKVGSKCWFLFVSFSSTFSSRPFVPLRICQFDLVCCCCSLVEIDAAAKSRSRCFLNALRIASAAEPPRKYLQCSD